MPFQSPAINTESLAEQLLERTSWDPACKSHMVREGWVEERCQKPVGICQAGAIWETSSATCHVINGAGSRADISICSSLLCSSWKSSCIGLGPWVSPTCVCSGVSWSWWEICHELLLRFGICRLLFCTVIIFHTLEQTPDPSAD